MKKIYFAFLMLILTQEVFSADGFIGKQGKLVFIFNVIVALLIIGGLGYWAWKRKQDENED